MALGQRLVEVILKARDETAAVFKKTEDAIGGFGGRASAILKGVGAAVAAIGIGKFFKDSVEEAAQAEVGMVRLGVAVDNAGGNFKKLRPALEDAVDGVRRLTTFTDDDLRAALTNLITLTGDTRGSMENLGLTADLAAFKQIGLSEASDIVAKAMNGNTTALNKMGIEGKDAATVLENLRKTVGGFAEGEAKTFSGSLLNLKNGWGEFKEAVGNAIIGTGEAGGAIGKLSGVLAGLEAWVVKNQVAIQGFIGAVIDAAVWVGERLSDAFIALQKYAVDLALVWDTRAAQLKGILGRILMDFGAFLGENRILLTLLGDGLTEISDRMADAGVRMVRESTRKLGELNGVRKEMYAEIEGATVASEGKQTAAAAEGHGKRTRITKDEAEQRAATAKEMAKELERVQGDIVVKTLMAERGLTKAQADEQAKRARATGESIGKQVKTVKEGYAEVDRLNLLLAAGFDQNVAPALSRTERSFDGLNTTMRAAPFTTIEGEVRKLATALGLGDDFVKQFMKDLDKAKGSGSDFGQELLAAARGAVGLAQGAGLIDDKMASAAQNALTFAENIGKALGGSPTGIIAAVGSLAGIIGSLFGESPETKARKQLLADNSRVIEANTRRIGDLVRLSTPGAKFAGVEEALTGFLSLRGDRLASGNKVNAFELGKQLVGAGVSREDLARIAEDLGIQIINKESGKLELGGLRQLLEAIQSTEFGQFGQDLGSQLERIRRGIGIGAIAPEDELAQILGALTAPGAGSEALTRALQPLLSGGIEGRSQAVTNLRDLFGQLNTGQLSASEFGALTGSEFLDVLEQLVALLSSDREFKLGAIGGTGNLAAGAGLPQLLADAFGVNAGTPDFGASIGAPLGESVDLLGSIDTKMGQLVSALAKDGEGPRQVIVQITGPIGAGADLAAIESAARRGVIEALDEQLYDLRQDRLSAQGSAVRNG